MKLLLVDPSLPSIAHSHSLIFKALKKITHPIQNYSLDYAHTFADAKKKLFEEPFDAVFIDQTCPDLIKKDLIIGANQLYAFQQIPILFITAIEGKTTFECFKYNQVEFLWRRKFTPNLLVEIMEYVRNRNQRTTC